MFSNKLLIAVLLAFCGLIIWSPPEMFVDESFLGKQSFAGCIDREPDVRKDKVKYRVESNDFGHILINGPRYPVFEYGDCLQISGLVDLPGEFDGFDYAKYLSLYDIAYVMNHAELSKVSHQNELKAFLLRNLYDLKGLVQMRINGLFTEPGAGFLSGLLLGSRKGLSAELTEDFQRTGLTHIVAVSGYNITILVVVVGSLFGFMNKDLRIVLTFIFIVGFVILVGMEAAVVRAGIMGSLGLVAILLGRQSLALRAFLLTVFLMLLWNPRYLLYDVGFQLSVLATLSLIVLAPKMEKFFEFVPKIFALRESLVCSLAAQIFTLPVIIWHFGQISLIAPIANIFVLPIIPFVMLFGAMAVVLNSDILAFFTSLLLDLILAFVGIFGDVQWAALKW